MLPLRRVRRCHAITCALLKWFRWLGCLQLPFYVFYFRPPRIRNNRESGDGGIFPRPCVYSHTTMFADMFKSSQISCTASSYNNTAINSLRNWQLWANPLNRAQTQLSGNRIPASNGRSQQDKRERSYTPPPPSEAAAERIAHKPKHIH